MDKQIQLASDLGKALQSRALKVSTAESCTGGLVAGAITEIAGSSNWFDQGLITYANHAKHQWLGVSDKLLGEHGAVSEPVVEAMAEALGLVR